MQHTDHRRTPWIQETAAECLTKFLTAITSYDFASAREQLHSGFYVVEGQKILTGNEIIEAFRGVQAAGQTRTIRIEIINQAESGDCTSIAYKHFAHVVNGESSIQKEWLESATLAKEGEKWKLLSIHSTKVNEE